MKPSCNKDDVLHTIQRVENGLCSGIAIKGQPPVRWRLADRMAHYRVPGVSVAVINDGQIEWAQGYGALEAGTAEPVTSETPFQAASISKPVSALAALRLVEQGLLELDQDVNARLVSWQVPENDFIQNKRVTLRGLVSHYAGLTVHGFRGYAAGAERPTLLQILDGVSPSNSDPIRVDVEPGSKGRYSGGGYCVMQQLCIDVTGQPFAELLTESVLKPLGMVHSSFEQPLPVETFKLAAKGHGVDGKVVEGGSHIYPELAAAGLWTTPSDLARVALDVQHTYAGRSGKVISTSMARQMLTYQWAKSASTPNPLLPANVGLGFFVTETRNAAYFSHSGGNEGYRCKLIALQDRGQGAVVMTNANLGMMLFPEILFSIAREYNWPDFLPVTRARAEIDPKVYQAYVGDYETESGEVVHIAVEEDRLVLQSEALGSMEIELHPESETQYFITELPYQVSFAQDEKGEVVEMRFGETIATKIE